MKIFLLVLFTTFPLFCYSTAQYPKPQTPNELHQLFGKYFSEKDLKGLGSLFHQDAVFIVDAQGTQVKGKDNITNILKGYMSGDVEMITHDVSIHENGEYAMIRSDWEIPNVQKGMALEVMKYVDNGWLYIIDNPNGF